MIISKDLESFINSSGRGGYFNINIVQKETIVSWHHRDINIYEAAQKEMIQLSNLLKGR